MELPPADYMSVPPEKPKKLYPNEAYSIYHQEPSQENFNKVMKTLDPTINKALVSLGQADNPILRDQAKVFTARAVRKFNPEAGAQIHTWVTGQLMQLRRSNRALNSPLKVPERIQLDAYHLDRKKKEYQELHQREPNIHELADFAHMPVKRITKVREQFLKVPSSGSVSDDTQSETETDYMTEAVSYIYDDVDDLGKKILEHRTGYGGAEVFSNSQLSKLLGVRPDVISKRSAKLGERLTEVSERLKRMYE